MRTELLVTSHVHTDGPIPGPHSLLTLTSVAHLPDGRVTDSISMNLRELPGARLHPVSLQSWRRRPEDWLRTRRATRPPAPAMTAYVQWVDRLTGRAVFVADTAEPDYLFLYWYLQRFAGRWPFAATLADAQLYERLGSPPCPLVGCHTTVPLARIS
jgi:hypothetical protein